MVSIAADDSGPRPPPGGVVIGIQPPTLRDQAPPAASERREQAAPAGLFDAAGGSREEVSRRFWQRLPSPELAAHERLFFEVYGQALQGREDAKSVLDGVIDDWVEPATAALVADGLAADQARAEARLGLAVVRGLLLDVLATGDSDGVDAAFEHFLDITRSRRRAPCDRLTRRGCRPTTAPFRQPLPWI